MDIFRTRRALLATTILSLGLMGSNAAFAEAPAATPDKGGIADIVVTARKVNESIQTTPVAVTALDATTLQQRQISNVFQIAQSTPSLSVQSGGTGNSGLIYLAIRGNAQNSPNSASDAAVGIYVDGVYYARPMVGNLGLLDLASAEVLRGTQGTLFGRNTTGGALSMTTVQPNGTLGGYLRGTYGNYNLASVEGALTVPLQGDELSMRVAGRYASHDAYGTNVTTGGVGPAQLKHDITARATLVYAPKSAPLTVTVSGDIIRTQDTYNNVALVGVNPTCAAAGLYASKNIGQYLQTDANFYNTYGDPKTANAKINDPYNENKAEGIYGTINYDLGGAKIKSITAYRHSITHDRSDIDGTPANIIAYRTDYEQRQFSEELQISGKTTNFDWIFGGMYFHESGTENSISQAFSGTDLAGLAIVFNNPAYAAGSISPSNQNLADFSASSKAVFAQANYHVTDAFRVTAGVRYTWDTRFINRHGIQAINGVDENIITPVAALGFPITVMKAGTCAVGVNAGIVAGSNCVDPHTANYSYPAWTFGVDYQIAKGQFIYAKTGGAAMAGGFNTRLTPVGYDSFQPEKVKDAEVGFKGDFLDRHLRTNIAAFYVWRNNAQNIVNIFANGTLSQFTQNAGNVHSYGLEFEGTAIPWQGMEVTLSASHLWSKYAAGSFTGISATTGLVIDRSGEAVPQAPEWNISAGFTQTVPIKGGEVRVSLNYAYTSSRNLGQDTPDLTNPASTPAQNAALVASYAAYNKLSTLDGYGLLNGKVSVTLDNGLEVSVWGKNITQSHYASSLFNGYLSLGTAVQFQGTPRTFGATVGYKF